MLLGNFLKVLNCVARTIPSGHQSVRQLSGSPGTARVIKEINLNECVNFLGNDVEFYKLTRVSTSAVVDFNPQNIGVIPDPYSWGKYSFPVLQKKAFRSIERGVPFVSLLKRKWNNRPQTRVEAILGNIISGFTPYIDLATITFFPYFMQAGYFVFFRPVMVFSGAGSAPTIKMLTDDTKNIESDPNSRYYVLVKISRKQALGIPIHELAIKFKGQSESSTSNSGNDSD